MKENKYFLDTSAWILSFKTKGYQTAKKRLRQAIENGYIVTSPLILMELVQGCHTNKEKNELLDTMSSLMQIIPEDKVWKLAIDMSFKLKRKGITIPTVDIIIASLVISHDLLLVHMDKHFNYIKQIDLRLKAKAFNEI